MTWIDIMEWQHGDGRGEVFAARDLGTDYDEDAVWCSECALNHIWEWHKEPHRSDGSIETTLGDWRVEGGNFHEHPARAEHRFVEFSRPGCELWLVYGYDKNRLFAMHFTPGLPRTKRFLASRNRVIEIGRRIERIKPGPWVRDLFAIDKAIRQSGKELPRPPLAAA